MPIPFLFAIGRLLLYFSRVLYRLWQDETARGLLYTVIALLVAGTAFYRFAEGWSWLDSLYFTVITLTTVGYGDLSPQQPMSKVFTIVYLLLGLGLLASLITLIADQSHPDTFDVSRKPTEDEGD